MSNHDLRIALTRVAEARALRRDAAFDLAPSASTASGGYTKTRVVRRADPAPARRASTELYDAGFDAFWELDFFGRVRRGLEASTAAARRRSKPRCSDAQVIVTAEVTRTYFELRGQQQQLDVARRNVANQQATLDLAQARLEAGSGTEFDTARAQAQLSARRSAPSHRSRRPWRAPSIGCRCWSAASPARCAPSSRRPQNLPPLPGIVPVGDPAGLLRRRPDIRVAERELAGATAQHRRRGGGSVPARHLHRQRRLRRRLVGRARRPRHGRLRARPRHFLGASSTSATCRRASPPPSGARKARCCAMNRPCSRRSRKPRTRWSPMPGRATGWCTTRPRCAPATPPPAWPGYVMKTAPATSCRCWTPSAPCSQSEDRWPAAVPRPPPA